VEVVHMAEVVSASDDLRFTWLRSGPDMNRVFKARRPEKFPDEGDANSLSFEPIIRLNGLKFGSVDVGHETRRELMLVVSKILVLESEDSSLLAIFERERKDSSLKPGTRVF
jgi:hypothetical protein